MLVLKRKEGQWVEIIHRSGDVIRLRVYDIQAIAGHPSRANLAFDDSARNFEIRRPERRATPEAEPELAGRLARLGNGKPAKSVRSDFGEVTDAMVWRGTLSISAVLPDPPCSIPVPEPGPELPEADPGDFAVS